MDQNVRIQKQKEIVDSTPYPAKSLWYLAQRLGKTLCCINYIKKHKINKILWVTPSKDLASIDIKKEFVKWKAEEYLDGLTTTTYASLNTITGFFDLVILDEVTSITENNLDSILNRRLVYTSMIGMTGTPSRDKEKLELLKKLDLTLSYELLLNEAVELGILSDYKVNVLKIPYQKEKLKVYEKWQKIIDSKTIGKFTIIEEKTLMEIKIAGKTYYRQLRYKRDTEEGDPLYVIRNNAVVDGYIIIKENNYGKISNAGKTYQISGNIIHESYAKNLNILRQKALGESLLKTEILKELLSSFSGKRNLVFCSTIAQSSKICKHTFNSNTDREDLELFQSFKINNLALVNSGGIGTTYEKIDNLIIGQCNNDTNGSIGQKLSRALLKQDAYKATIWLLMVESTPDERWVNEVLKSLNSKNVNYINYEKMEG